MNLDEDSIDELLQDLAELITDRQKAEMVETLVTDLNDRGYPWDYNDKRTGTSTAEEE